MTLINQAITTKKETPIQKDVTILGTGRWAAATAYYLSKRIGFNVKMFEREKATGNSKLWETYTNEYLKDKSNTQYFLPKNVTFTHDLTEAVNFGEYVFIAITSQGLDILMTQIQNIDNYQTKKYCLCMKGIEVSTERRLSEILIAHGVPKSNIAVLVGPAQASDVVGELPLNLITASYSKTLAKEISKNLTHPASIGTKNSIKINTSEDIIGTELAAAAKNVYGIVAGILQAGGAENYKGPLMSAAVNEFAPFINCLEDQNHKNFGWETSAGLAFLGDFEATFFNETGNNLTFGKQIIKNHSVDKNFLVENGVKIPEGYTTCLALIKIKNAYNKSHSKKIQLPIAQTLFNILNNKISIEEATIQLINAMGNSKLLNVTSAEVASTNQEIIESSKK